VRRSLSLPVLERPGGRSGALEAQYPWAITEFIESSIQPLSPNLTETLRILKVLLQDPKIAKHSILTSANAPEFPDAEWTNLVNGRSINLDAVLSGMFSTSTTDERSEALGGGLELRFGAVAPTKLVSDAGTWTIAFDHLHAATLFVFPHRARELDAYKHYIVGLFAAMHTSFHDRVVSFDKAVRKRLRAAEMLSSPTSRSSWTSKLLSSTPLASESLARSGSQTRDLLASPNQKLATIGTEGGVPPTWAPADVSTFAMCARWPDIRVLTAPTVFRTELTVSIGPCAGGHVGSQFLLQSSFPSFLVVVSLVLLVVVVGRTIRGQIILSFPHYLIIPPQGTLGVSLND
jgi:hypothetical protein